MIFRQTGQLNKSLHVLGTQHFPTHLLMGAPPVLIESGVTCLGPLYASEIRKVLAEQSPAYLFLTHVHFDHCGAAAYLKQHFPGLRIGASRKAAEIMQRPNAVATMKRLNQDVRQWVDRENPGAASEVAFAPFEVDLVLAEGDRMDIGNGMSVQVFETPGHTWDSLSYHIPEKKWIFLGEAGGVIGPSGFFATEFIVDFDAYMATLERLAKLELELVCQCHFQVSTGRDAATFFERSIQAALAFRNKVETYLDEANGDIDKVVTRIKAEEYDCQPGPKQPLSAYLINLAARVRHLAAKD